MRGIFLALAQDVDKFFGEAPVVAVIIMKRRMAPLVIPWSRFSASHGAHAVNDVIEGQALAKRFEQAVIVPPHRLTVSSIWVIPVIKRAEACLVEDGSVPGKQPAEPLGKARQALFDEWPIVWLKVTDDPHVCVEKRVKARRERVASKNSSVPDCGGKAIIDKIENHDAVIKFGPEGLLEILCNAASLKWGNSLHLRAAVEGGLAGQTRKV